MNISKPFVFCEVEVALDVQQHLPEEAEPLLLKLLGLIEHQLHVLHVLRSALTQLIQSLLILLLGLGGNTHTQNIHLTEINDILRDLTDLGTTQACPVVNANNLPSVINGFSKHKKESSVKVKGFQWDRSHLGKREANVGVVMERGRCSIQSHINNATLDTAVLPL